jgi:hypothetical protein
MDETQLPLYPALAGLPVYDECDERSHSLMRGAGDGRTVRECATAREVEECLKRPDLVPLGGVRVGSGGAKAVVVYFAGRE